MDRLFKLLPALLVLAGLTVPVPGASAELTASSPSDLSAWSTPARPTTPPAEPAHFVAPGEIEDSYEDSSHELSDFALSLVVRVTRDARARHIATLRLRATVSDKDLSAGSCRGPPAAA